MKKILFLLLLAVAGYGQIPTTGQEFDLDYGVRNNVSPTDDNAPYFTVQNSDNVLGKSNTSVWAKKIYVDNLEAKKQFLSTGLIKNGLVTTNTSTTFNVTAGIGVISNFDDPENPTTTLVSFPAFTAVTPTYLNTSNITYVAINSTPAIVMQASPFTDSQRRDLIILGAVIHSDLATINTVNNISAPVNADTNQLHDLYEFIGALNLSGNKYTANGANLSLNKSAGDIGKLGVNFANNWKDPNKITIASGTALTFRYRFSNSSEGADRTTLDPTFYEVAGVSTPVPPGRFSIQTVTLFQTGLTRIQPGQNTYATLADARAAILTRAYNVEPNIAANGITRAYIILAHNASSLQNASTSEIVEAQKFGGITSGGTAVTDTAIIAALGYTPENVANKSDVFVTDGTGSKYYTADYLNSKLPTTYAKVVYVNNANPNSATIFDLNNPPLVNDNLLKNDVNNLYIGNDASTWVYNGSVYVTKTVTSEISNFQIYGTTTDAGNSKTADIQRSGDIRTSAFSISETGFLVYKNGSDTVLNGGHLSFYNNANTDGNAFQLNASNGIDVWNYASSTWTKRYTFTSDGMIGINVTPTATLHVKNPTDNAGLNLDSPDDKYSTFNMLHNGVNKASYYLEPTTNKLFIETSGTDLNIQANGGGSAVISNAILLNTPTAPTATAGTNTTQIATTAFVQGIKALTVRKISTNTTLADSDNGTIILLTASCMVTLPNGLMSGFNCSFSTQTGVTMTYSLGGSVTLINNTGTTMAQNLSHTIVNTGTANEYLTAGSL